MLTTKQFFPPVLSILLFVVIASAQTTEFTYQGSLKDGANVANGNYDFEFRLFAVDTGGSAIGTLQRLNVAVANGVFAVKLDFGAQFTGANRWLEIAVKPAGGGGFQQLLPRVPVSSSPYSIRSLNAATADLSSNSQQLGGVNANQFILTTDARLSDSRNPLPNSTSYIQNTLVTQAASNFNVSGTGTANVFNAALQFNIGGNRVLSIPGAGNLFTGIGSGTSNTSGANNSFFGTQTGAANTTATGNSFFGYRAGFVNTAGGNSFFGNFAGASNTTATNNSFFGNIAGISNQTGNDNSFFGSGVGGSNTTGNRNSFFGSGAGNANSTSNDNSFFGFRAGFSNMAHDNSFFGTQAGELSVADFNSIFGSQAGRNTTTGAVNSFFGYFAGYGNTTGAYNSFFGANAGENNTTGNFNAFFGQEAGRNNGAGAANSFFGASAGYRNTADGNSFFGSSTGFNNTTGENNSFFGYRAGEVNTTGSNNTAVGFSANFSTGNLTYATTIGAGSVASLSNSIFLGRPDGSDAVRIPGSVVINGSLVVSTLGSAGSTSICLNAANRLSPCSSSLRYKTSVQSFNGGLNIVRQLRPITFNWIDGGTRDVGFGAEEVEKIEPLLVTRNATGEIEGVKYSQISTVLVNAVKEQQTEIEQLKEQNKQFQEQLKQQQQQMDALKRLVCLQRPQAEVCK